MRVVQNSIPVFTRNVSEAEVGSALDGMGDVRVGLSLQHSVSWDDELIHPDREYAPGWAKSNKMEQE